MNAYINQLDNILYVKKIQNPVGPSKPALCIHFGVTNERKSASIVFTFMAAFMVCEFWRMI